MHYLRTEIDYQFAALILARIGYEHGAGDVRAQGLRGQGQKRSVDMRPIFHADVIPCQRRQRHALRKGETAGLLIALQCQKSDLRRLLRDRVARIADDVVLGVVVRVGAPAFDKFCLSGGLGDLLHFRRCQKVFNLKEHRSFLPLLCAEAPSISAGSRKGRVDAKLLPWMPWRKNWAAPRSYSLTCWTCPATALCSCASREPTTNKRAFSTRVSSLRKHRATRCRGRRWQRRSVRRVLPSVAGSFSISGMWAPPCFRVSSGRTAPRSRCANR